MRLITARLLLVATATLLVGALGAPKAHALQCGPGVHWVDTCGAGVDSFANTTAVVELVFDPLGLTTGPTPVGPITLQGPTDVARDAASDESTNFPGALGSSLDGHSDVIDTEIVALSLTGGGAQLRVGAGTGVGPSPLGASLGTIVEQAGDNTLADSFFHVFFEVNVFGTFLYNLSSAPFLLQASNLNGVPPTVTYLHPFGNIGLNLYLSSNPLNVNIAAPVARLTQGVHIVPEPSTAALVGLGLLGMIAAGRKLRLRG